MGLCCAKEQTQINELINSFQNSNDNIIQDTKIDPLSISELRLETVKSIKSTEEKELDLVIIDYLQLMHSTVFQNNRVQEISEISR